MNGPVLERPPVSKERPKAAEPVREQQRILTSNHAHYASKVETEDADVVRAKQISERKDMANQSSATSAAVPNETTIITGSTVSILDIDQFTGFLRLCGYFGGAISLIMMVAGSTSALVGLMFIFSVLLMFCGS